MAKKKKTIVALKCGECAEVNYTLYKPKNTKEKLEKKKYCKKCKASTNHKETKAS